MFNLENQFVAYASHHNNKVNIGIHLTCVPLILWSMIVFTNPIFGSPILQPSTFGPLEPIASFLESSIGLTFGSLWVLGNLGFYLVLEPVATILYTPVLLALTFHANYFYETTPNAIIIAFVVSINYLIFLKISFFWCCYFR